MLPSSTHVLSLGPKWCYNCYHFPIREQRTWLYPFFFFFFNWRRPQLSKTITSALILLFRTKANSHRNYRLCCLYVRCFPKFHSVLFSIKKRVNDKRYLIIFVTEMVLTIQSVYLNHYKWANIDSSFHQEKSCIDTNLLILTWFSISIFLQ